MFDALNFRSIWIEESRFGMPKDSQNNNKNPRDPQHYLGGSNGEKAAKLVIAGAAVVGVVYVAKKLTGN